jgi:hypothetical protein
MPLVCFFRETMAWKFAFEINRPLDTPKKGTDEFVWFPLKSKKKKKQFVCLFFGII